MGKPAGQKELEQVDTVFRALAHETRRHILLVLRFRGGSMTAGEIADRFHCAWPTTTRHLGVLVRSGLVSVRRHGRERVYTLRADRLKATAGEWLRWLDSDEAAVRGDRGV